MDFSKLFDLTGKNAMIVGGAGGLGKLVAEAFAVAGFQKSGLTLEQYQGL